MMKSALKDLRALTKDTTLEERLNIAHSSIAMGQISDNPEVHHDVCTALLWLRDLLPATPDADLKRLAREAIATAEYHSEVRH